MQAILSRQPEHSRRHRHRPARARGANRAQAIHDSFILKQEMTPEDRKALVAAVPEAFVQRDRAFHQLSAELAEAARAADPARERALFGEMVDACAGCHARYAGGRFPGLKAD
ncbi:MAG: cytochrome c [Gammaproteobacteria bacterium]|nr:cytochrome c [Gammaproteobacteria bacterium]